MKSYNLHKHSIAFIKEVDNRLEDIYSKSLPREKFFLLYSIIERESSKHPDKHLRNMMARLKAEYLKTLLGKYYKQFIDISIDKRIIQTDNHYIVGEKSKDYWINLNFEKMVKEEDMIVQKYITTNNEKLYKELSKNKQLSNYPVKLRPVIKALNKIDFDDESARTWLDDLTSNGYFRDELGKFNTHKYNTYLRMINDMTDKDWVVVEDKKTGRIFHTFNLIKRELRGFCYVDGEKLVQSDLKSSQPYFLASRLVKDNPDNENIVSFFNDVTQKDIYQVLLDEYTKLNGSNNFQDIKLVKKKGKVVKREVTIKEFKDRNDIKPEFLKVMYKGVQGGAVLLNVFKRKYPEVYKQINIFKQDQKNELALTLQKEEANIFIEGFNSLNQEIWCLPCHDSLYVKESNHQVMLDTLINIFNNNNYKEYKLK